MYFYNKYFKELKAYIVVIVNISKKFVITAYISEGIKKGEIIWKTR